MRAFSSEGQYMHDLDHSLGCDTQLIDPTLSETWRWGRSHRTTIVQAAAAGNDAVV